MDGLGMLLLALFLVWVCAVGRDTAGGTARMVGAILVLAAGYVVGRLAGAHRWVTATAGVVVAASVLVALLAGGLPWRAGPTAAPLGYANADAALAVQAAALAGLAAVVVGGRRGWGLVAVAVALIIWPVLALSAAGAVTGLLVLLTLLACVVSTGRGARRGALLRPWRAAALALGVAVVTATVLAGVTHSDSAAAVLTERRVDLWHDAVRIVGDHPLVGVGPGQFDDASPTAADPDTKAAHSAVLEQAAETGVPGALLLVALATWALWRARRPGSNPRVVAVAAAAWLALVVHSAVDYVADFPAVLLLAGLVMGWATAAGVAARDASAAPRATPPGPGSGSRG
jgi:O-antigen ligase